VSQTVHSNLCVNLTQDEYAEGNTNIILKNKYKKDNIDSL